MKISVFGVVRNCEKYLELEFNRWKKIVPPDASLNFLLIESDSSDGTLNVLRDLSEKNPEFSYLTLGSIKEKIGKRTERLALCRNRYLQELSSPAYSDSDYIIVADFDNVNKLLTAEALRSCWIRDDWDVCAANQTGPYYDVWALRHPDWSPNDCWKEYDFLREHGLRRYPALNAAVLRRMIRIATDANWIAVDSAFGGAAVYKKSILLSARYDGVDDNGNEVVEHVALHRQIKDAGGRIYVNPAFVNAKYTEHTNFLRSASRTWLILTSYLKDFRDSLLRRR